MSYGFLSVELLIYEGNANIYVGWKKEDMKS
jgi:hypothetical protein